MRKIVLIVEDDPLLADALVSLVEDDLECIGIVASSVTDAAELLNTQIDLALLDVEVLDGVTYPLASRLVRDRIPVVFVSGSDPTHVPQDIARVPFLKKPVMPQQLISAAREYL